MFEVRLWLSKQGRIKYVSHLDMFRLMQRAVRRAEIPLWYTEGFNPHPYISFLLALSLGTEGLREPVDIRIVDEMTTDEIKNRLNAAMPEGLCIEAVTTPVMKPSEIAFGSYRVYYGDSVSESELFTALTSGELTCEKSGKKGNKKIMKTVNVSEHIKSFELHTENGGTVLDTILPAGSVFNLNPQQLSAAVSSYLGREIVPERVIRLSLLTSDLKEFE